MTASVIPCTYLRVKRSPASPLFLGAGIVTLKPVVLGQQSIPCRGVSERLGWGRKSPTPRPGLQRACYLSTLSGHLVYPTSISQTCGFRLPYPVHWVSRVLAAVPTPSPTSSRFGELNPQPALSSSDNSSLAPSLCLTSTGHNLPRPLHPLSVACLALVFSFQLHRQGPSQLPFLLLLLLT